MLLKIFKYLIVFFTIVVVSFFISLKSGDEKQTSSPPQIENSARAITYTFALKGGELKLSADKVSFGKSLNDCSLENLEATYTLKEKIMKIKSKLCHVDVKKKIAHLGPNVVVSSDDLFLETDSAILDWGKLVLFGNSKLTGRNGKTKFSAEGFSVKKKEKIILKHAKIIKGD